MPGEPPRHGRSAGASLQRHDLRSRLPTLDGGGK
jgi:hypothetical protein